MVSASLKKIADAALEIEDDVLTEVRDPLIMALDEGEILILVGLEGLKLGSLPAALILLQVPRDVVREEGLKQVQLVVVGIVELLALLSLQEVVCAILVAVLDDILLELLLAEYLLLQDDAVLELELCGLQGIQSLSEIFHVDCPRGGLVGQIVQGGRLLRTECFTFRHFSFSVLIL